MSDIMVVPGRMDPWIIGSRVAALLSGTVCIKHSRISRHFPPNTHCGGNCRPWWFFLRVNKLSSTLTVVLGPPIAIWYASRSAAQISRRKLFQSTTVFLLISNSCLQNSTVVSSLLRQYIKRTTYFESISGGRKQGKYHEFNDSSFSRCTVQNRRQHLRILFIVFNSRYILLF